MCLAESKSRQRKTFPPLLRRCCIVCSRTFCLGGPWSKVGHREDLLYPEEQQDPGSCQGALGSSSGALYGAVMATRWEPSLNPLSSLCRAILLCLDSFKLNSLHPALKVIFKYLTIKLNMMLVLIKRLKLEGFTLNPGVEVVKNRFWGCSCV